MTRSLLITRPLPETVVNAARARFDVTVREDVTPMTRDETVAALGAYDAILPTLGDPLDAATFAAAGDPRTMVLANFGVGYNHIDYAEAAAKYDCEKMHDGWNEDSEGKFYFVRNPALGLWAHQSSFSG